MDDEDDFQFDFTEEEVFRALRLVVPEAEAREQSAAYAAQYEPGMDWAASETTLLYLAVASDTGRQGVERIRRGLQASRRPEWMLQQPRASEADVARQWADLVAGENKDWESRLSELRRKLQQEGKLPPSFQE